MTEDLLAAEAAYAAAAEISPAMEKLSAYMSAAASAVSETARTAVRTSQAARPSMTTSARARRR